MSAARAFSGISGDALGLLEAYARLLRESNEAVNLVSRRSQDDILDRHVAHALTLAHRPLRAGARAVDWGTGGGLPAVPLAIRFPDVEFVAVDSIGKKTRALERIVAELGLPNVSVWNGRAERFDARAHYALSRATARLDRLWSWTRRILDPIETEAGEWPGGLLCLKGGDLKPERAALRRLDAGAEVESIDLADVYDCEDWHGKYILHVRKARG